LYIKRIKRLYEKNHNFFSFFLKANLAASVAAANSANSAPSPLPYSPVTTPQYRNAAGHDIAVINTTQSNLITIPIQGEGINIRQGGKNQHCYKT